MNIKDLLTGVVVVSIILALATLVNHFQQTDSEVWKIEKLEVVDFVGDPKENLMDWITVDLEKNEMRKRYFTQYEISAFDPEEVTLLGDTIIWQKYVDKFEFNQGQRHFKMYLVKKD